MKQKKLKCKNLGKMLEYGTGNYFISVEISCDSTVKHYFKYKIGKRTIWKFMTRENEEN